MRPILISLLALAATTSAFAGEKKDDKDKKPDGAYVSISPVALPVIVDGQLIRIQTGLHHQWKALQIAWNDAGLARDPEPYTVARAILEPLAL